MKEIISSVVRKWMAYSIKRGYADLNIRKVLIWQEWNLDTIPHLENVDKKSSGLENF
jgi:hypothetical protein